MDLRHVAIIPDGNRRWAKKHGLPAFEGHRRGAEAMRNIVTYLISQKMEYLTFWGFSTDNWKRSQNEISAIFEILAVQIEKDTPWLHNQGVRLRYIGRIDELPEFLQVAINQAGKLTKDNAGMTLTL
ncbi:unnamed protein product, partial [marine sediment metagenome]